MADDASRSAAGRLAGKAALVTGAASGFGRGIARRFAAEGARVGVLDIDAAGAERVAAELGDGALPIACDVADRASVEAGARAAFDAFGTVDILINNAGWSHPNRPLTEVDEATLRRLYDVNVFSIYHFTQVFVPHWRAAGGGAMINVGSTAGIRPRPGLSWYNSTKGAVHLMTKSLAVELAPDAIRVCALAPVMGATGLLETFMGKPDTPENRAGFLATIPLGRLSEPADMASAALFLASDEAAFLTGVILEVDGGRTI